MSSRLASIDELERWVLSGGHWRVVDISRERAVVELCSCTGEAMERLEAADPKVIRYLRTSPGELGRG
jgi:hypothetical protein